LIYQNTLKEPDPENNNEIVNLKIIKKFTQINQRPFSESDFSEIQNFYPSLFFKQQNIVILPISNSDFYLPEIDIKSLSEVLQTTVIRYENNKSSASFSIAVATNGQFDLEAFFGEEGDYIKGQTDRFKNLIAAVQPKIEEFNKICATSKDRAKIIEEFNKICATSKDRAKISEYNDFIYKKLEEGNVIFRYYGFDLNKLMEPERELLQEALAYKID
jgi:hypothetical protein